ncbi:meprin A subunit beta [Melospiza melodia melodia]|uniref:meprin A subunit beta n=1 Tax=Melospiza melodia melodia TaxID=1914991 RepID=UPI002FD1322B
MSNASCISLSAFLIISFFLSPPQPSPETTEIDLDGGIDQDIFDINEALGLDLFEGDIKLPVDRNSIIGDNYRWPHVIPYVLENSLEMNAKGVILKAFEQYRLKTCIDFKPWEGEKNYISVFKGSGCWSSVGNLQMGLQQLSIGANCDRIGTVQHEFLHALGFWHEQSRSDRDDYVTIVWDRIQSGKEHNFNKYDDNRSDFLNVPYDYNSVMHYSKTAFKNGTDPTIITNIPDFTDVIGQRMDFSEHDLKKLNRLYNCTSSLSFMDTCSFELENICGMIQSSDDNSDWQRLSQVPAGPNTDHTNMGECKDSGYFMHFDTSAGGEGSTAVLESRILYPKRGFQCLQFYLYNSGNENDRLNVWVREYTSANPNGTWRFIKEIKGSPETYWQLHHVSLNVTSKFRVVFQGVRGSGLSSGGLSIDDINLSETQCPHHVWHIRNFTHLLNTSPAGKKGIIYSPPFYSSEGYAFQVSLYVNGTADNPFNLGIYLSLISGANDDHLKWPCPWQQVTMILLDQHPDIRQQMSNQRSVTTDPERLSESSSNYTWDRPDKVGSEATFPNGTKYMRGPGVGTSAFLTHERLRSRNFIKEDGVYILLTMEDISHLLSTQPSIPPPLVTTASATTTTKAGPGPIATTEPPIGTEITITTASTTTASTTTASTTTASTTTSTTTTSTTTASTTTASTTTSTTTASTTTASITTASITTASTTTSTTTASTTSTTSQPEDPEVPAFCPNNPCENDGVCVIVNRAPVCRCPAGDNWWYMGEKCERKGSTHENTVIAVSSTITVFVVMLIVTITTAVCLKKKYKQGKDNKESVTLEETKTSF